MHPFWKFAVMRMVLMVSLLVVVVEADISTTTMRTIKPLRKVDTVCTQKLDGSEMKICATNGTDFVSFHNECRLREANRKKGIAAFKKVALASCMSSVNITNATHNRPTMEPIAVESKELNKPKITTEESILKLVYKVTPTTINTKKVNKIHSTTIRPVLRLVEKVPSTTVHSEKFKQNSLPTIAPLEKITMATDKVVTNTMRSMVKPVNIANQPNNVNIVSTTSTTTNVTPIDETAIRPKDIPLNKVAMVDGVTPIKFHIKKLDKNTAKVIRPTDTTVDEVTSKGVTQIKFHIKNLDKNTSTASRPTVTTMNDITSTTTRPISKPVPSATVDKVSPIVIQPSNVNVKLSTPVDGTTIHPKGMPAIKAFVVEEVTSTTGLDKKTSTTIRPTKHKATSPTTNHSIDTPVNEVEPDNLHPKNVNEMEEQSIISDAEPTDDDVVLVVSSKKVESSTLRPKADEIKTNFRSKVAPVNKDPTYPQASITNIPPKPEQVEARKIIPCPYVFNPVCATHDGIQATFINECHVNAENVKTGKDWTIYKEGSCNERKIEHTSQQHKRPSEVRSYNKNDNFPNIPIKMEQTNQQHKRPSEVRSYNKNENFPNTNINMENTNQPHKRPSEVRSYNKNENTHIEMELTNKQQNGPTEVQNYDQNGNYPNTPIEIGGGDIVYTPIIERTDYEDGPIVEHAYPSYATPRMRNLEPNRAQLFPSYETSALKNFRPINEQYRNLQMINFGPNNEQSSPSQRAPVFSNFDPNSGREQFHPSHSAPAMVNYGSNHERQPSFAHYRAPALSKIGALNEREQSHSSNRAPAISNLGSNNEQPSPQHRAPVLSNFNSNSEHEQFHPSHSAPVSLNFRPNNERKQSFSFHRVQAMPNLRSMAKFAPISEYSKPSYRAPMISNIGPNNEKFYSSQKESVRTNFDTNNKQFFQSHRTTAMKNFENTRHQNPLLNSHSRFISPVSYGKRTPVSYSGKPAINIPQGELSITKRSPKDSYQPQNLPCVKVFNPVCASFSGVKSTFINECLVNAENRKTGSEWSVFSHGVCAEDYSSTSNKNILKTTSTRSNDEKSYKTEQTKDPHVIYAPPKFQTEIVQDPYDAQNYGPLPEQINFKDTNSYLPSLQRQTNFESDKHYSSPLSGPTNFAPIPGVEFQRFEEYTAPLFGANSYSPLSPEEKNTEGSPKFPTAAEGVPQYAPTGLILPNFEVSAHYKLPLPNVDEIPNKYEPFSSSEDFEPPCRPSAEKKPIRVVNENVPIDKVSICNFGAAQLPICGSYKNKLRSFGNICELMLRNILRNETWAPIYEGRCKCPEVCSIELEPICVTRNGIMETIPNKCYYERLKIQDPFSSWQYLFKGECLLSPLNPAFQRLTKPADPLTVKVPSYENTNFAFSNSRNLVNPDANEQNTLNPPLKYPSEYRGYREIKKSSNAESQNGIAIATKTSFNAITTSSSSTLMQPVTTPTTSNPIYVTTSRPHGQITVATTKATAKLIPFKKPITRFVVSAKKPYRTSVYSSNPDSVIMRLAKPKAFAAVKSNSGRSFRRTSDRSWWR